MIKPSMLRNTTLRVSLIYALVFTASVLAILVLVYWYSVAYLMRQTDSVIIADVTALAERYQRSGVSGLRELLSSRVLRPRPTSSEVYLLVDRNYSPLAGNLSRWPVQPPDAPQQWVDFVLGEPNEGEIDLRRARARVFRLAGGFHLLAGRDISDFEKVRRRLLAAMAYGLAATLALGALGAVLVTRLVLRRLETINATSQEIMSGDLSRRIPLSGADDEFDRLSNNLNSMLDRISGLMEGIKRVSDNIAHDLKTPLARLRNRLELARTDDAKANLQSETIDQALVETDQLLNTFDALLRIARVETAKPNTAFEKVDLGIVIDDVIELYSPIAEENHIRIDTRQHRVRPQDSQLFSAAATPKPWVMGDRDLLFQAFANVLDNAVKYSSDNSTIDVGIDIAADRTTKDEASARHAKRSTATAANQDGRRHANHNHRNNAYRVIVTIADHGPGLSDDEYEKVTQRFYRADNARSTPGNGLGLSLVKAVADMHDAELTLSTNHPGLVVSLTFDAATNRSADNAPS